MKEDVAQIVLASIRRLHGVLNAEHLRIREASAAFFMEASGRRGPIHWDVDCSSNTRCVYGSRELSVPVSWDASRYQLEDFDEGEDINEIVKDAAEGFALLFVGHLLGLTVERHLQVSEKCDYVCEDSTVLEVSGTRNRRYVNDRKRKKTRQARENPLGPRFLVFIGNVTDFEAWFSSGSTNERSS